MKISLLFLWIATSSTCLLTAYQSMRYYQTVTKQNSVEKQWQVAQTEARKAGKNASHVSERWKAYNKQELWRVAQQMRPALQIINKQTQKNEKNYLGFGRISVEMDSVIKANFPRIFQYSISKGRIWQHRNGQIKPFDVSNHNYMEVLKKETRLGEPVTLEVSEVYRLDSLGNKVFTQPVNPILHFFRMQGL